MKTPAFSLFKRPLLPFTLFLALVNGTIAQSTSDIVWSTNTYILGKQVLSVSFSSDGAMLASCLNRTISLWRVGDKSLLGTFSMRSEVTSAAFSPDQSLVAAGGGGSGLSIWRLSDGSRIVGSFTEDSDNVPYAAAFSPDSRLFARAQSESGLRYIIPVYPPPGSTALPFDYPGDAVASFDVDFSPDGTLLAAGFDNNAAKLFRMSDGTLLRELIGHAGPVTSVDFSPDGRLLATAADGDARLWRVPEGTLVRTIPGGGGGPVISLGNVALGRARFSADGKMLLTLSNSAVRFWSVSDGRLLLTYPNLEAFSMAVSPNGKHFAYGTGSPYGTNAAVVVARIPLLFTDISRANGQLILGWSGGSGLYQLQSTTNVANGPWQNVGAPNTATAATNPVASTIFYRVQSLPYP